MNDIELYCKRRKFPVAWYKELEDILESNGFSNWHLRDHAISDLITFIQENVVLGLPLMGQGEAPTNSSTERRKDEDASGA